MDSKISQREQWTSKLGFILAAAGSAVGLGNLWGFAYRASQGGGAAFVLLYILIVLIVCLPVFVAEMALGRNAMASTLLAPVKLAGKELVSIRNSFLYSSFRNSIILFSDNGMDCRYLVPFFIFWITKEFN